MTCSTCHPLHAHHVKRGRGTLLDLILGFSSQTLMSSTCYLGRMRVGVGHLLKPSFRYFCFFHHNFMPLTYLTCGRGMRHLLKRRFRYFDHNFMTLTFFTCFTGYVMQCIPYFSRDDMTSPFKLYQDVVLKLLRAADILGEGFRLFIDNFYISVELMEDLWARGMYACGTIRCNRKGLPKALVVRKHKGLANSVFFLSVSTCC